MTSSKNILVKDIKDHTGHGFTQMDTDRELFNGITGNEKFYKIGENLCRSVSHSRTLGGDEGEKLTKIMKVIQPTPASHRLMVRNTTP